MMRMWSLGRKESTLVSQEMFSKAAAIPVEVEAVVWQAELPRM